MKTVKLYVKMCCKLVLFTALLGGCSGYPDYEVTNPPFVDIKSLDMYIGDEVQITASPEDVTFRWSSENEEVVSVTQTGMAKAVSEGFSTIVVKSANDEIKIDVIVRVFIPLTDINLPITSLRMFAGDKTQIWAYPVPTNASVTTFSWRSENPAVAIVNKNGAVTAISPGTTNIIVSSGSIEKIVTVEIGALYKCNKTGWSIASFSDQTEHDGGGVTKIIDDNYDDGGFWHSQYGPDVPCPHWVVIDMQRQVMIGRVVTLRRSIGDNKTLQYFVSDDADVDSDTWTLIAEGEYASSTADHTLSLDVSEFVSGRYLKLVLLDSFRDNVFTGTCEIEVWEFRGE
jgi:hypothetical protein